MVATFGKKIIWEIIWEKLKQAVKFESSGNVSDIEICDTIEHQVNDFVLQLILSSNGFVNSK